MTIKRCAVRSVIYAECKSLDDVIVESNLERIRKRGIKINTKGGGMRSIPYSRVREVFTTGVDFNWSKKEEGFRR